MLDSEHSSPESWGIADANAQATEGTPAGPSRGGTDFPGYTAINIRNNRLSPHLRHRLGGIWLRDGFREDFNISNDVFFSLVEGQVYFGNYFITVPLMAITEGGLKFPMPGLLRDFLSYFGLTPCQLSVNCFRIINSCVEICRRRGIEFRLSDLMTMFTLTRNRKSWKYFLTPRSSDHDIFRRLPDSEKWGSVYLRVHGAYNFPPGEENTNAVPTQWGDPG